MRFQYLDNVSFKHDLKLVNDKKNYGLGPHTDKLSKVISVLFYLPKDSTHQGTGTSIYIPKDANLLDKELPVSGNKTKLIERIKESNLE
jgi:hypothetical protein